MLTQNSFLDDFESGNLSVNATGEIITGKSSTILEQSGLNWQVNKVSLFTPDNKPSGFFATQRADTGKCFAAFTNAYEIFQNSELATLVETLSNHFGYELHNGGSFNGGNKVYLQLKQDSINNFGTNRDRLDNFITAINSHDGSTSLNFGLTNITISCQNTFFAAYKKMNNKVKHSENMRDKIESAIRDIKGLKEQEKSMFETFFKFLEKPATPEIVKETIAKIFDVDMMKTSNELRKELSGRAFNQVNDVLLSVSSEMKQKGGNLWGLFSGFTHYTTHKASAPNRENGKLESKLFGQQNKIDTQAFKLLAEMV